MIYISKKKVKKRIFLLVCLFFVLMFIVYFHNDTLWVNDFDKELKNPKTNQAPLYQVEWSVLDSSIDTCFDLAMSPSEDLYMVCDAVYTGESTVVKFDNNGNLIWDALIEGEFRSIALDSSNNVYIAGAIPHEYTSGEDMILAKFSSSGVFQWSKKYSVRDYDIAYAVTVDSSNNVYIGGESYVIGDWVNKDALLVKYSSSGNCLWERFLDLRDEDYIRGLTTDSSNNVYLTGHHRLYSTPDDVFIAKYSSSGAFEWSENWGSAYDEEAYDIALDSANNIYITGLEYDPTTQEDLLLLKFNSAGDLQWSQTWAGGSLDRGYSIDLSSDGDIFIGGVTYEQSAGLFDILLSVYNSAGTMKWWGRWGGSNHDTGRGIAVTSSKNVYIAGDYGIDAFTEEFCLLKYNPAPIITIHSPQPNQLFSYTAPSFYVEISDPELIEKYYTVNDGPSYTFISSIGNINQAEWDVCPHGDVSLKFYGRDVAGAVYEEVIVIKDIEAPYFEIISPTMYQVFTDVAPNYQLSTSDTDINMIWYTLNGGEDIIAMGLTGQINQNEWVVLDNGSVFIEFFLEDNAGNIASREVEVFKNYKIPLIVINKPLPNQICGLNAPGYSVSTFSLWPIDKIWYSMNDGQNITTTETEGTINQLEWDLWGNGTVTLNFYTNNSIGNIGKAEVTVRKDVYFPFIDIYSPIANHIYGISAPNYNVSIRSVILDSKWYSFNYGNNIEFIDDVGVFDQPAWDACTNGSVMITFYANNTDGVINSKEIPLFKDISCPNITIITPTTEIFYGLETINFSLSIDETQLNKTWYSLNGGDNYFFNGMSGTIDQIAWDNCGNGTVTIRFYANNTIGNIGFAEITVRKDVYYPFITIISPESGVLCGIKSPNYNISVSTLDIDSMWYNLNDRMNFTISTFFGTVDQLYWDLFGSENITITFYVNNSYGHLNFKSVQLIKNVSKPNIIIISPQPNDLFGIDTIEYYVSIIDSSLDKRWYTLNGGSKYFFTINNGYLDQIAWESCGNGTVIITFFANNSLGNIGSAQVIIHRDIYFPFIEVFSPTEGQSCGLLPPAYNLSISTSALDTIWYTLNNGAINIITSTEGLIDQVIWEDYGEQIISIKFYANNTYGIINFKEVTVNKRTYLVNRNAYAIIIGISDYPGTDYDLSYCDDDALAVRNMLINDYNFKPGNIIYLEDSSASRDAIDNAFSQIESLISSDDIFYFYYSGHGGSELVNVGTSNIVIQSPHPYPDYYDHTWWISSTDAAYIRVHFELLDLESGYDYLYIGDTYITQGYAYQALTGYNSDFWSDWIPLLNDNRIYLRMITDSIIHYWGFRIDQIEVIRYSNPHYLCSYDSLPSNPSNYYLDTLLDSKLDSLNCNHKYVIVDACNSGGLIPESQETNRYIMTACKGGQFSMEDSYLDHGVFTYYLLNSLDNANDQNNDGVISIEECFSYVSSETRSYSAGYGPGYQYHPQQYDGIQGQAVLYPSIGSLQINPVDNRLYYSFYLYGHGSLKTLNITICSISPTITFKTEEIKNLIISPTGFGYYSGYIDLEAGYVVSGIQLLAEIEGNNLITIELFIGDSDGDGLSDIFEILEGLDPNSNDTDSDGLNDYDEFYGPTDPLNSDTDYDDLLDGEEVYIYLTDPLNDDTDTDGLLDGEEVHIYLTDPLNDDTDSDGMPDGWEINYSLDPLIDDSALDPDNDLLINLLEYQYSAHPFNNDTDSDGLLDGDEVHTYLTDPLDDDTDSDGLIDGREVNIYDTDPLNDDSDSDRLLDGEEVDIYGTDPLNPDTDSDTMPDYWEVINSLNPLVNDTMLDPDLDNLKNVEEYNWDTDPQNPDTDGDGWSDGDEVHVYNTDPLDPESYPPPSTPTNILGYNIFILIGVIFIIALIMKLRIKKEII